jgi:hypothetical protein
MRGVALTARSEESRIQETKVKVITVVVVWWRVWRSVDNKGEAKGRFGVNVSGTGGNWNGERREAGGRK